MGGKCTKIGQQGGEDDSEEDSSSTSDEGSNSDDDDDDEDEAPDVELRGAGIYSQHANVTSTEGTCVLRSHGSAARNTFVNGVSLAVLQEQINQQERLKASPKASASPGAGGMFGMLAGGGWDAFLMRKARP